MQFLKQSTAFTFRIGPFVDATDGVTAETGLTIGQSDILISKNGGAFAQTSASPTTTHDADGWYQCPLTDTDTDTLGTLEVQITMSGALPVWKHFTVLPANVYDSMIGASDKLDVDAYQITNDAITAAALNANAVTEIQAGLATSAEVSAIGSGTGAALNFEVIEDNASAPIKTIAGVGTETGTYANTLANDGTTHQIASAANAIDWVYGFDVGSARAASKVVLRASMAAVTDTVTVSAYNFLTTAWDTRTTITGTTETTYDIPLLAGHTGTGSDAGKVYIRFVFSEADAGTLVIDEAYVQAQQSGSLVGYQDALIWVDTNGSNTNTVPYVDGTADNPVSTIAAAYTLATATGLKGIRFLSGSSVTLTQSAANWRFVGSATIALNGQSIADAVFRDSYTISGTSTGDDAEFIDCGIGTATIAHAYFIDCRFKGTLTMAASNEYFITGGYDAVSSGTCTFVFAADTELMVRDWHGGIQLNDMVAGNSAIIDGAGRVVVDGSSTGGSITIRGMFAEATGAATFVTAGGAIVDTARWAEDQNITNATGSVGSVASGGIVAASLDDDAVTKIADGLLKRDFASVTGEAARSMLNALRFLRNKWSVSSGTLTVTKEDDSTSAWTSALSSDAAADPVTGSDPS